VKSDKPLIQIFASISNMCVEWRRGNDKGQRNKKGRQKGRIEIGEG